MNQTNTSNYVSYTTFKKQFELIEGLNIHIVNHDQIKLFKPYPYRRSLIGRGFTLKDLKEKRVDKVLGDYEYYFYNKSLNDIFPESCRLDSCRETIINHDSLSAPEQQNYYRAPV